MKFVSICVTIAMMGSIVFQEIGARESNAVEVSADYVFKSAEDFSKEIFTDPMNNNGSIRYQLYTPNNTKDACFIEPTPGEFDNCSFNPKYKSHFLIHGFAEILKPGNLFDVLKDTLLDHGNYNVIIVDWTLYNNFPLLKAIDNIPKVGRKVAELIQFIINRTGADSRKFHCIGHSLGAHVCGHTARQIPNFYRVTGLDPGGITITKLFRKNILLKYSDAYYVDCIHTSFIQTGLGLGLIQPIADLDFYVNGGILQNHCKFGRKYRVFKGDVLTFSTVIDKTYCDHFISIEYFINSIQENCKFLATKCKNFISAVLNPIVKLCPSNSSLTTTMGFYSKKIPGLPPKSVFYVETSEFPPYCKESK